MTVLLLILENPTLFALAFRHSTTRSQTQSAGSVASNQLLPVSNMKRRSFKSDPLSLNPLFAGLTRVAYSHKTALSAPLK